MVRQRHSPVRTQTTTDDSIEQRVNTVGRVLPFIEAKIVIRKQEKIPTMAFRESFVPKDIMS